MNKPVLLLSVLLPLTLVSCASLETQVKVDEAQTELKKLTTATTLYPVSLINKSGLSPDAIKLKEAEASKLVEATCGKTHTEIVGKSIESGATISEIKSLILGLEEAFSICAAHHGVNSSVNMKLSDGKIITMPEYIKQFDTTLSTYTKASEDHKQAERQDASIIMGAMLAGTAAYAIGSRSNSGYSGYGVNPNQHYVNPYTTANGTYVSGYQRTNPNRTCLDNIRGCR